MENEELLKRLEELVEENKSLKMRNIELTKKVGELKNWTSLRDGVIIPRLEERYGHVGCMATQITNPISQIIKGLLDINKLAEINENNYERAKEIAIELVGIICRYEWISLNRAQKGWEKFKFRR
ncbi:hypothetical protein Z965_02475 [Clostridium novyi A str. BKT29909]|uniref:hypothetical protein n=1 Tax=Clostridium novyi TaxID=1542 RepID=UPI0004D822A0|nr:hypothetical protein [Clostridium novyi]KEH89624.1 hypothetical protein Z965_02475 [Clostridium novyi A str. BKT29909]